jgi:hypothetical protein
MGDKGKTGVRGGSGNIKGSRSLKRDNGASAERICPFHIAGEGQQASEPRAAAMRRPDRREYDRLRFVRNR